MAAPIAHGKPTRLVKISELARMSGVPRATIKHYIRQGLLPGPARRTSRNMAYYDARLAARVRIIKELQQTRHLPLKVIADVLEPAPSSAIRAGLDDSQRRLVGEASRAAARTRITPHASQAGRSRAQVLRELRVSTGDLAVLEDLGVIAPHPSRPQDQDEDEGRATENLANHSPDSEVYTGADLAILEILDKARRAGLGDLFTLDVLPPYMEAVDALVDAELAVLHERMAGTAVPAGAPAGDMAAQLGEALVMALRQKLLARALAKRAGARHRSTRRDTDTSEAENQASALVMRMK